MSTTYVDADGHILEPTNLWVDGLESKYQDRAIRLFKEDSGLESWSFSGEKVPFYGDGLSSNVATIGKTKEWRREHVFEKRDFTWEDGLAMNRGAWDPAARIEVMDKERIDKSILYPTLALDLAGTVDPALGAAYCRVYNDWIIQFCEHNPERLFPAVTLPWCDVDECITELDRIKHMSSKAVQAPAGAPNDIPFGDSNWDDLWAAFQDRDIPVSLHVGSAGTSTNSIHYPELETPSWFLFSNSTDIQLSFMSFFQGSVFDRFPRLKLVVLESGCAWMPWLLHRMDEKYEILGFTIDLKNKPSEYFPEHCWISMDPDDEMGLFAIQYLGADSLIWAYDYPHSDSPVDPVPNLDKTLNSLSGEDQNKVKGDNAIDLYHLN